MSKQVGLDKIAMQEFGRNLWLSRQEKRLTLKQVSHKLEIPERIIDGMKHERFVNYRALRHLMEFYNKRAHIVIVTKKPPHAEAFAHHFSLFIRFYPRLNG